MSELNRQNPEIIPHNPEEVEPQINAQENQQPNPVEQSVEPAIKQIEVSQFTPEPVAPPEMSEPSPDAAANLSQTQELKTIEHNLQESAGAMDAESDIMQVLIDYHQKTKNQGQ